MAPLLRNAALNVAGEAAWGFQAALVSSATVLTLLLRHHGAGPGLIALIAAIDVGLILLPQAFSPFLFTARSGRKRQIILWHFFPMIPCLLLVAAGAWWGGRLPAGWAPALLLAAWAGFIGCVGAVGAVWMDWIASLFPDRVRGTVMGLGWGASSGLGILGALTSAWCIEHLPAPQVFALLYAAAGLVAGLSIATFALVQDPADAATAPPRTTSPSALWRRCRESLAHPNLRHYLAARALAWMGFAWLPFVAVHYAAGGLSEPAIVAAGAAQTLGGAVGCLGLGRLGDLRGHRLGAILGVAAQCLALAALLLVPGMPGCLLAFAGAGVAGASITISHNNVLIESCPHDDRVAHLVAANLACGVVAVLVPLAAGPLVARFGCGFLFAASLVPSLAALLWLVVAVREPRAR